ncbi:MAG TPA: endolytic transglycosylase MltG [Gaiellaceae bacterium]
MARSAAFVLVAAFLGLAAPAQAQAPVTLRIVFPEGFSVRQMADRVSEVRKIAIRKRQVTPRLTGVAYRAAAARARAPRAFRPLLKRRSVEGFLFPALYEFTQHTRAPELVRDQLAAFQERWRGIDLRPARARRLNAYDVLIIASMIERETAVAAERRLVSAVIYNRLKADMALSIDATLRYGLGIPGNRPLTKAHLRSRNRYNTRLYKGLTPTPIGNPGVPSMRAAARPAPRNYLYYLRRPNSVRHFFTASEEEFCAKAREWGYTEDC